MKNRTAFKIFALGFVLHLILGFMKWAHLPIPAFVLVLPSLIMVAGGLILFYKLMRSQRVQAFLDQE